MKTGLGLHSRLVQRLAPRSYGGLDDCYSNESVSTYIDGANEVLVASHDIGEADSEDDGEKPGSQKPFPGLLR